MNNITQRIPGILLCLVMASVASFLGELAPLVGAPVFAIFIGMILNTFYKPSDSIQIGVKYTSKFILQLAVILLGFGLNLSQVLAVGKSSLPIIISTITTSLVVAFLLQRALKLDVNTATLVGVGSSICGGSAIAATAPVIEADDHDIAQAISVIFLFNILAALIFPTLGDMIGLSNDGFAIFAGTAVNDTSSVTATATAWDGIHGSNTLDGATVVKLTRTLAIIPITLFLSFYRLRKSQSNGQLKQQSPKISKIFPMFIIYFILASLLTTILTQVGINPSIFNPLKQLSKFFIVMAMAAIGLNTHPLKLIKTGKQAIILGACCWIAITLVSLGMQHLFHLW
ncbi:YeiH family protein [Streptococcus pacificus]|uniref:YeiH family putative sulfate export transporter n=1 Tax=Streptococcus pacificus TaxID=2740577 RepID=A0ABS0ZIJ3_9STRE|nr:YeiH family protein [Streptococcus pacificus]MBJ8325809.1 YeiH family putative sulfate export transporter [Streptococcus pacificus]